ncbi:MAG: Jag N-terminal domain-containing protein [Endomicrobium sp.]|nr:Jag N-terminal domain-containing protein [Endomicrobium sp.]
MFIDTPIEENFIVPEIEIKGKTVEDAIHKGLEMLGCAREEIEVRVLDEGSNGLFGFMGSKPATILVSAPQNCCKNQGCFTDAKEPQEKVKRALTNILSKMGMPAKSLKTSFDKEKDTVSAEIYANGSGNYVIGKGGQTLDALEYLTQIIANNKLDSKIKVSLDCENYRIKQNDKLRILADKAVEYVKRTGKIYRFANLSAKERKTIHLYLESDQSVETFSEGEGAARKLGIKLSSKKTA